MLFKIQCLDLSKAFDIAFRYSVGGYRCTLQKNLIEQIIYSQEIREREHGSARLRGERLPRDHEASHQLRGQDRRRRLW